MVAHELNFNLQTGKNCILSTCNGDLDERQKVILTVTELNNLFCARCSDYCKFLFFFFLLQSRLCYYSILGQTLARLKPPDVGFYFEKGTPLNQLFSMQ